MDCKRINPLYISYTQGNPCYMLFCYFKTYIVPSPSADNVTKHVAWMFPWLFLDFSGLLSNIFYMFIYGLSTKYEVKMA